MISSNNAATFNKIFALNYMLNLKNKSLGQLCLDASNTYKEKPAFSLFHENKIIRRVTYSQMSRKAMQIAKLLTELGIQKGDKVILLSENSPEWPCAYFGIALAGAVSVPVLTGFSYEQVQYITLHSGAKAICKSQNFNKYQSYLPSIYIDELNDSSVTDFTPIYCDEDELASIIYTSGTQGTSKGVMLSGKNLISSAISSEIFVKLTPKDKMLSVLPLAHSYECSLGLLAPVYSGASITYLSKPPSPSVLLPAFKLVRPSAILTVPLLIEKIYRSSIKPKLETNIIYKFPLTKRLAERIAGRKLYKSLGGNLRFFGIGGAPLSWEVESFLYRAKFPFSIGYGLTEAAPFVAGNAPHKFKLNTGISEAKGVSLRIIDGEIQTKGPNIMLGYYKDEEKTNKTITEDGWLKTGDLGYLDKNGRLHINGRLKSLILGPSGENIYPEEIENLLGSSHLIEESLVYVGKKGEIVALVRLNDAAKAAKDATIHALEDLKIWVNKKLAGFSRINKIEVKEDPFEKTPTMKIKRYLYINSKKQ